MSPERSGALRLGIVGLGYIGTTVGAGFHRHPDATVAAVCDLDASLLASVGDRFGVDSDQRYDEYGEMVEAASLDAVLVATPHTLHYEQVLAALDADLHVYCDKPLTTDLERARELVSRADRSDRTLMVGYQRHLQRAFQRARDRLTECGGADWVTASITQPWIESSRDSWRLDPALSGGGFLYDTGSHVLDGVLWASGLTPVSVDASMEFHDEGVDRLAHLDVTFASGARGSFALNGDAAAVREHLHFWHPEGAVYVEGTEWGSRRVRFVDADSGEYAPYDDVGAQRSRAEAFVETVGEGTDPPATPRDALRVTALTEAAYASARTGDRVEVDSSI